MTDEKALFKYPEPDRNLTIGWRGLFTFMGPGFILASATVGSGEVFFAPRGAAIFGYGILWCLLMGALAKGFMCYAGTRYIILTGEHPVARWGQLFPGPKNWFPILMGLLAIASFPSWIGGLANMLGNMTMMLTGGSLSVPLWATLYIFGTLALVLAGGYGWVEKTQTAIVVIMTVTTLIALFASNPQWGQIIFGMLPSMPVYEPWVAAKYPAVAGRKIWLEMVAYVGAIGGGVYDYIGYVGLYRAKGWGILGMPNLKEVEEKILATSCDQQLPLPRDKEEVAKAMTWLKASQVDTMVSFGALLIITVAFTALGASMLHTQQLIPAGDKLLEYQARFLTSLHPSLVYLYYLGVWCALWGTLYSIMELYPSTTYEAFAPASKWVREKGRTGCAKFVYPYIVAVGLAYNWLGFNVVVILTIGGLLGGTLGCGLWALAQVWTESKMLPPEYRMKPWVRYATILSGIFLLTMATLSIGQQFGFIK